MALDGQTEAILSILVAALSGPRSSSFTLCSTMGALDPTSAIPLPQLKSFGLTHILYDPSHPLSIPLSLLSLSPIFLFVSYFTLLVFDRRLTVLLLATGQVSQSHTHMSPSRRSSMHEVFWWCGRRTNDSS